MSAPPDGSAPPDLLSWRPQRATVVGWILVAIAGYVYWVTARDFDSPRDDFFFLSDAFVHMRTWLERSLGPNDVITIDGRSYVPFGPFPAIVLMPLVAFIGPEAADQLGAEVNTLCAAGAIGLCWVLLGRLGVSKLVDRFWVVLLFGFSTTMWWVTLRGGVWHMSQVMATVLTLGCLVELAGRQRPLLVGFLAGAAFLTRAPLAFAIPIYFLMLHPERPLEVAQTIGGYVRSTMARWPIREWVTMAIGIVPAVAFFLWYNAARFGDPFESGYMLAALPPFLEERRATLGLFSLNHVPMNIDLLFIRLPTRIEEFPFFRPDGNGMSVLFTSPGLLLAAFAPWRERRSWLLLGAAVLVLIPTLLYYGGGWLQFGYRYFLDSIPFVVALAGLAVARRGLPWPWIVVIVFGVAINSAGWHWNDKL